MVRGQVATEGALVQRMTDAIARTATEAVATGDPAAVAAAHAAIDAAAAWQALHSAARDAAQRAFQLALTVPCHEPAWEAFKALHDRLIVALEHSDERADLISLWHHSPETPDASPPADAV